MLDFVWKVWDLYAGIFNEFQMTYFTFGNGHRTSLGSVLFACLVVGLVVSVFWKGAKAQ